VTSDAPALERLVGDVPGFLERGFGTAPVHVPAADRGGFGDLLSLDDVDRLVAGSGLRAPAFRMVRHGRTLSRTDLTRRVRIGSRPVDDLVDVRAVHEAFAAGATLVLQGLHRSWAPVAGLCRELELALTHPVQANAYLTPPVAQGLDLHADPHDVFALQTHGSKRWVVHAPGEAEPWDLELRAGDVLYLPAGTRHAAQTIDQPSLHLTIGVRTVRWRDLLRRAIDGVLDDPRFAGSLPPGWAARPDELAGTLQDRVRDLVDVLTDELSAVDLCTAEAEAFLTSGAPDLTGGLRDLLELEELSDHTTLLRRPGTVCRIRPGGQRIELVLGDRTLRLPGALLAAVERITERERFTPADLDDLLDAGSRRVLCRRLVREGLLTFVRDDDRPPTAGTSRGGAMPAQPDAVATAVDAGV
jgi:bifunctional lysine-specific demethylase and histidyl-hydroxylase NO66